MPSRPRIAIIDPGPTATESGSARIAQRWQRFLGRRYRTTVDADWHVAADDPPDLMIALHARRSAPSLERFVGAHPARPTIVVLTGADLDRGVADPATERSLALATRLVVPDSEALASLPPAARARAETIEPSSPTLARRAPDPRSFTLVMVGHVRDEEDATIAWHAFERVARHDRSIRLDHVADTDDSRFGAAAVAMALRCPGYRWLDGLSPALTRQHIRRARALVIPSSMAGGGRALIEAVTSGVPVLASAIPGNRGLVGCDYAGTFRAGDDAALAALIERVRREPAFLAMLTRQCAERAPLFAPVRERGRLFTLVASCLGSRPPS